MILPQRRVLKVSRGVRQERVRALECVYVLHARTHTHRSCCIHGAAMPKRYVQINLCCLPDCPIGHCAGFRETCGQSTSFVCAAGRPIACEAASRTIPADTDRRCQRCCSRWLLAPGGVNLHVHSLCSVHLFVHPTHV